MQDSCERYNKDSSFIQGRKLLDSINNRQIPKHSCSLWSWRFIS